MMMLHQANILALLALASAGPFCLVLECQAGGGRNEGIELAKTKWFAECAKQLDQHKLAWAKPDQIGETLKQLLAAMPHDDNSRVWMKTREELAGLADLVNVDEQCTVDELVLGHPRRLRFSLPLYLGYRHLLSGYVEHFRRKQVEACVSKISKEVEDVIEVGLSEAEKHDANVLARNAPALRTGSFLFEKETFETTQDELVAGIYQFLKTTDSPLSSNEAKFNAVFDDRMEFCTRVEETTRKTLDDYFKIRRLDSNLPSFLQPEPFKWIRVAIACWLFKENQSATRSLVLEKHVEFKRNQPSRASKMLMDCFKPKRRAGE